MGTDGSGRENHPRWPIGFIVAVALFALAGGVLNALYSFGMVFATDSCGTGSAPGSSLVCDSNGWWLLTLIPWVGLLGAVLTAVTGAFLARRRGRSPWLAALPGLGVYLASAAVTYGTFSI